MEDDLEFFSQCSYCARVLPTKNCVTCENCLALVYCSQHCKSRDFSNTSNPDHAHSKWCSLLKIFMHGSNSVTTFPFTYSDQTTCEAFSSGKLFRFLRLYGIYNLGLWKYLFYTSGSGPGEELTLWDGLISTDPSRLDLSSTHPDLIAAREEVAYLNAYMSPSEAILLSTAPPIEPLVPGRPRLLSVDLTDWAAFYAWRGLPLTSPLAFLLHWPLTIYFIFNNLLRHIGEDAYLSIIYQESLTIHLVGVEREVDLLPVFKELEHLISPEIKQIQLIFIGPTISPAAHPTLWYLSPRISARLWRGLYHDFVAENLRCGRTETPDVVIGFNAGLSTYPTWPETVDLLYKLGKPVFFTDSCQYSCLCSLRLLEELKLSSTGEVGPKSTNFDFLSSLVLNPFRCPLRIPSMSTKWPWLSNAFIFSPCVDISLTKQMLDIKL
ncbi:hypothetical protein AAHC03_016829 [Spirometra sp. Aus1]